jgi:aquaporin Z
MIAAFRSHWTHYAIEAWGLGTFMFVAAAVAYAQSYAAFPPLAGRAVFGAAMGLTVVALVYSPWGAISGAHFNPSLSLAFAWLGKLAPWDAAFYVVAQFAGGIAGFALAVLAFGSRLAAPPAGDIVTVPGPWGVAPAFAAEFAMSFLLLTVVLHVSNATGPLARWTGVFAGCLVALFITFEAPLSGMSLNPARSFASALPAGVWTAMWVYFTAPPLGMFAAAVVFAGERGAHAVKCGRLNHAGAVGCIFRCAFGDPWGRPES